MSTCDDPIKVLQHLDEILFILSMEEHLSIDAVFPAFAVDLCLDCVFDLGEFDYLTGFLYAGFDTETLAASCSSRPNNFSGLR